MPLTHVLIYQEKVIVAEGMFRYLLFEPCPKKISVKFCRRALAEADLAWVCAWKQGIMREFCEIGRQREKDGTIML